MYNNEVPSEPQKEQLYRTLSWAAQRGLTATFHWNNNRSVPHLLDVLERVNRETANRAATVVDRASQRCVAGQSCAHQGARRRLADAKRASIFVARLSSVSAVPRRSGLRRRSGARSEWEFPIGGGTDAHRVMSYNPFVSLQWMLDGRTITGLPTRTPDETPTRIEALRLYTQGSAWFSFDDTRRGSLAVGKLADLAVLTEDYLTIPVDRIGKIRSVLTMVGGRIVHASDRYAALELKERAQR